jgi:hypothetical protein
MLPAIVFGLALWSSIMLVIICINKYATALRQSRKLGMGLAGMLYFIGTIVLWTFLYWPSH